MFSKQVLGIQVSVVGTVGPQNTGLATPQSNYTVDGGSPNVFAPTEDQSVHYNTRFYLSSILPNGQHTLVVTNLLNSDALFIDYFLVYKSQNDSTFGPPVATVTLTTTVGSTSHTSGAGISSGSPTNTGAIVGSVFGAAILIIAAVAIILWMRGPKRQNTDKTIISNGKLSRHF